MSWSVAASLVFGSNSAVVAFMAFDSAVQEQRALISGKSTICSRKLKRGTIQINVLLFFCSIFSRISSFCKIKQHLSFSTLFLYLIWSNQTQKTEIKFFFFSNWVGGQERNTLHFYQKTVLTKRSINNINLMNKCLRGNKILIFQLSYLTLLCTYVKAVQF